MTTELEVVIRISGNLFPDAVGAALFDYTYVAATGHTHMETTVSTSARQIETGVSGLTAAESAELTQAATLLDSAIEGSLTMREIIRVLLAVSAGKSTYDSGTGAVTFRDQADTKNRIVATTSNSARTSVTVDGS